MVRFRKSKKVGPVRFNVTKSGVSMSGGAPGARVSVNSKGEVRRTVGVPGTGVYDTKKVAGGRGSKQAEDHGEAGQLELSAVVVAVAGRDLSDGRPEAAYLHPVEVDDAAQVASLAGRGNRDGLLVPEGGTYQVLVLIQRQDNPSLWGRKETDTPKALPVGHLSKRDYDRWAPKFDGRNIQVLVNVQPTLLDVRFLPAMLEGAEQPDVFQSDQAPPSTTAVEVPPAAAAGWHADPRDASTLRWWDGTTWTGHTSPRA